MDPSKVREHEFAIASMDLVAEDIYRMVIASDVAREIAPGQFMNLQVPGDGAHILRVPLSFAHADADAGTVELVFAVVGEGTERLSQMAVGDRSVLTGPSGRGWWLPASEGRALLVSGGVGLPPVEAAAGMLAAAGIAYDIVCGARTASVLLEGRAHALAAGGSPDCHVVCCTDDGTAGEPGMPHEQVERLLATRAYTQIYTCGPEVMMAAVARLALGHDIACQVSREAMMGCGFGACACCNVPLASGGFALCCQDGPVFDAREVAW